MNRRTYVRFAIVLMLLLVFMTGFVAGTIVGFKMSMKELSSCKVVSCAEMGITNEDVQVCEVCESTVSKRVKAIR